MSADNTSIPSQALSPQEWCRLNRISLSTYRKLAKQGLGPETIKVGGGAIRVRERITPEATAEWRKRMAERSTPALKARMQSRGYVLLKQADKHIVFLSHHVTLEDAEATLAARHADDPTIEIHERLVRVVDVEARP